MSEIVLRTWVRAASWWEELRTDRGATAIEYALMLALIAIVIVTAVAFLGQSTSNKFADSQLTAGLGS